MMRCEVCQGREIIRLPVYKPVELSTAPGPDHETIDAGYREFPCPACSPWAEADRVKVMRASCILSYRYKNQRGALDVARRDAAGRLITMLCKDDSFLRVTERPVPAKDSYVLGNDDACIEVTIGVVAKSTVATMEERIAQHQEGLAQEVIEEAVAQIRNWGSAFDHQHSITKSRAYEFIRGALATVLTRRKVRET